MMMCQYLRVVGLRVSSSDYSGNCIKLTSCTSSGIVYQLAMSCSPFVLKLDAHSEYIIMSLTKTGRISTPWSCFVQGCKIIGSIDYDISYILVILGCSRETRKYFQ